MLAAVVAVGAAVYGLISQTDWSRISGRSNIAAISGAGSGLVGYWTFDEGSGASAADTSGNGNNGTLVNAPTWGTGRIGGALALNGTSQYVLVGSPAVLDITGAVTVSAWINLNDSLLNRKIVGKGATGSGATQWQYQIYDNGGGDLGFRVSNSQTLMGCRSSGGLIAPGGWHNVAGVYNGSDTVNFYIDGVQACTASTPGFGALNPFGNFTIGASSGGTSGFMSGSIDDVRVYDRALAPAEISELYAFGGGTTTGGTSGGSTTPPPATPSSLSSTCAPANIRCVDATAGPNQEYTSIQACANVAQPGDTCLVFPGTYPEHVTTRSSGSSDSARITFKANGLVSMQGFDIQNQFVTIDGFDITGYTVQYRGNIVTYRGADYCEILNNNIHDTSLNVYGILFDSRGATDNSGANHCLVKGNTLNRLGMQALVVAGAYNLFEQNTIENLGDSDSVYFFGHDNTIRRNVFKYGVRTPGNLHHTDFAQTFSDSNPNGQSYNILFEENWIENIDAQMAQLTSGLNTSNTYAPGVHDVVFRRNVFVDLPSNFNAEMPGVVLDHNTFYHVAYSLSGISYVSSLNRGDASRGTVTSNAIIASGSSNSSGMYGNAGASFTQPALGYAIPSADAAGVYADLIANGYVFNSRLQAKAFALTDISQFVLSDQYSTYKTQLYSLLSDVKALDYRTRSTFRADYNFVAGAAPTYGAKPASAVNCAKVYPAYVFDFCEPHGVNGGNPQLRDPSNPMGPDGLPFTLDDGVKPLPGSPLCGRGESGSDIGALSCDANTVFVGGTPGAVFPTNPPAISNPVTPVTPAATPTNTVVTTHSAASAPYNVTLNNPSSSASGANTQSPAPTVPNNAAPASIKLAAFTRTLAVGSSGEDVRSLQKFLNASGYAVAASGAGSSGNESAYYGLKTLNALVRYQIDHGISPALGVLDARTMTYINGLITAPTTGSTPPARSAATPAAGYAFTRNLTLGMTGEDVRALQQYLNAHGFTVSAAGAGSPGYESAYFGLKTQMAVSAYQRSMGITPTAGYFGPKTRASIK